jgi:hypothetical protein
MALAIALKITEAARRALQEFLRHCEPGSVATVAWSESGVRTRSMPDGTIQFNGTGPEWGIGAYKRSNIPQGEIVTISGIELWFAQGEISERLNGKTLDYRAGRFHVE